MTSGTSDKKEIGQVKWFNNKSGFGFITVVKGDHLGEDVFVHHSDLFVSEEQYRYLIAGEYVEFEISDIADSESSDTTHKFKAVKVSGVCSGKLMCEVRRQLRDEQPESRSRSGNRPELNTTDDKVKKEWMVVRRKPPAPRR
tara:strand:- start:5687 stop:6112 length:426 start_codon:yes stop_codon:yes gene_type:complete